MPFDPHFTGEVRVACGDLNGDGYDDVICAAGPGGGPNVTAFSGRDGSRLCSFFAYDPAFTGGVFVAAADLNGDGYDDIICGADRAAGRRWWLCGGARPPLRSRSLPKKHTGAPRFRRELFLKMLAGGAHMPTAADRFTARR